MCVCVCARACVSVGSAELLAVKQLFVQEELEQGNDVSSISLQRMQTRAQIEREVDVVRTLRHENVVRVLGSGECSGCLVRNAPRLCHRWSLACKGPSSGWESI